MSFFKIIAKLCANEGRAKSRVTIPTPARRVAPVTQVVLPAHSDSSLPDMRESLDYRALSPASSPMTASPDTLTPRATPISPDEVTLTPIKEETRRALSADSLEQTSGDSGRDSVDVCALRGRLKKIEHLIRAIVEMSEEVSMFANVHAPGLLAQRRAAQLEWMARELPRFLSGEVSSAWVSVIQGKAKKLLSLCKYELSDAEVLLKTFAAANVALKAKAAELSRMQFSPISAGASPAPVSPVPSRMSR